MTLRKFGVGLVSVGILGVFFSVLTDLLPGARPGIQSTQILGIEISIFILLIGSLTFFADPTEKLDARQRVRNFMDQMLHLPAFAWVLAGFLIAYILFFIEPMFLNADIRMTYFNRYLPDRAPIGNDLIVILDLAKGWFIENKSPYTIGFYPPFTYAVFAPVLLVDDYPTLFKFFTLFSILGYCFLTLVLPAKMTDKRNLPLILLFFMTGLVSYGFQFELERGQYNVLTFLLCLWAIYIFHYYPKYRIFAYLLFSFSVQLKIYPAIFIVMLIDDWKAWKDILVRFTGIALFNVLLLFVMGSQIFLDFLKMVSTQLSTPGWSWNGNHSISAFVFNLAKDGYRVIEADRLETIRQNSGLLETSLLLIFGVLFVVTALIAYKRNSAGLDPYLLIACTMGALVIPISNDYTLSILAAPVALVLASAPEPKPIAQKLLSIVMVLGLSLAYASVLIPAKYRPYYLSNAFPALFLILIFAVVLNWIRYKNPEVPTADVQTV